VVGLPSDPPLFFSVATAAFVRRRIRRLRKAINMNPNMKTTAFFLAMVLTVFLSGGVLGQQKPTTGYAPVNGLKMYLRDPRQRRACGVAPRARLWAISGTGTIGSASFPKRGK